MPLLFQASITYASTRTEAEDCKSLARAAQLRKDTRDSEFVKQALFTLH